MKASIRLAEVFGIDEGEITEVADISNLTNVEEAIINLWGFDPDEVHEVSDKIWVETPF